VQIFLRSLLFNVAFVVATLILIVIALPTFFMTRHGILAIAKLWGRITVWLLTTICRVEVDWRGLEKIPPGALLVASKHQSSWETLALLRLFDDPVFILKRELTWIPLLGWMMVKAQMIPVDRGKRSVALASMAERARAALADRRQIIIFPEGTRRPVGAEPRYKFGVGYLYAETDTPCLPIALNSGVFWPRRKFLRYPGTIRVEVLDPIPPGLDQAAFMARLQNEIETATERLIAEGEAELARNGIKSPREAAAAAAAED
jgi:1-acyl-sn-glycerol-3-phosphate acyltransferase